MPRKFVLRRNSRKPDSRKTSGMGLGAYVEEGAKIGKNVTISPYASLLSGSIIGANCFIGSHCVIGHPSKMQLQAADFSATSPKVKDFVVEKPITRIGAGSIIRSGSVIYSHVVAGRRLRTGHNVLIRENVTLGESCVVGTNAIIDGYVRIGDNSMVQSQCYITQAVLIGSNVFVAPGCIFMDNKKIILGEGLERIAVQDFVRIGGGTKVLPGITIGEYALIGAGSVVAKDVPPKAVAYGVPARVRAFQNDQEVKEYVDSVKGWQ